MRNKHVVYTAIPDAMFLECDNLEHLNTEGAFFRCDCGHVCSFDRLTSQYEIYRCIECGDEVKVS